MSDFCSIGRHDSSLVIIVFVERDFVRVYSLSLAGVGIVYCTVWYHHRKTAAQQPSSRLFLLRCVVGVLHHDQIELFVRYLNDSGNNSVH